MKTFTMFLLLIGLSVNLLAQQTVTGIISDDQNNPLTNVIIGVKGTEFKTVTSETGKYFITIPDGFKTLTFQLEGFMVQEMEISNDVLNVKMAREISNLLDLSLEELMQLSVTSASRSVQKITEAPSTITVITKDMIRNRGYEDIGDVLRDLPGVELQHMNGYFGTVFAQRGMIGDENKRTVLMVNGVSDNQLWGREVFTGQLLPLHNVERIEVIWGPASALYGANAFNGIINVITTPNAGSGTSIVTFGGGSFESTWGRFKTYQPINNNLSIAVSGSIYDSKGADFKHNIDPQFSSAFTDKSTALDAQVKYKNTTLYVRNYHLAEGIGNFLAVPFKYLYEFRNVNIPDSLKGFGKGNTICSPIFGEEGLRYVIGGTTVSLSQEAEPIKDLKLRFQAYYRQTDLEPDHWDYVYNVRTRASATNPEKKDTSYFDKVNSWHNSNNSGMELFATLSKDWATTTAGIQFDYINTQTDYIKRTYTTYNGIYEQLTPPIDMLRISFRNIGFCLQTIVPIGKKLQFTVGSRFDANNHYGNQINPRVGIVSTINDNLTAKVMYGTAFRAPTAREMYATGIGKGGRVANPDLKPERLQSFEGALLYNIKNKVFNELNLFYNVAEDVIVADVAIPGDKTQNQNLSDMNVLGFEYKLIAEPIKNLKFYGNLSYQKGKQSIFVKKTKDIYDPIVTDTANIAKYEIDIPNISNWKWNAGVDFRAFKFLNLNMMVNSVSKRSTTYTNPLREVDGYLIANFTANIQVTQSLNFTLQVRNIFDTEYYDPGVRSANVTKYLTTIEQPGRVIYLKIDVTF